MCESFRRYNFVMSFHNDNNRLLVFSLLGPLLGPVIGNLIRYLITLRVLVIRPRPTIRHQGTPFVSNFVVVISCLTGCFCQHCFCIKIVKQCRLVIRSRHWVKFYIDYILDPCYPCLDPCYPCLDPCYPCLDPCYLSKSTVITISQCLHF